MARCPECNTILPIPPDVALYDRLYCEECGALLEVVSLNPLELEYVFDYEDLGEEDEWEEEWEEEDWEEEEEDLFDEDLEDEERW
ncbi:MAG: hypothetical protein RML46_07740 [Anaerolineae bacterium]|nr:hypothetical protein [Anaerolineae bacterium]MDW8068788.1 hypothetical protein [Anaerolineae bacterium]